MPKVNRTLKNRLTLMSTCALAGVVMMLATTLGTSTAQGATSKAARLPALTVAVTSAVPEYGAIYVAQNLGYFTTLGLKVTTLDVAGANGPGYLVAGTADLDFYSGPIAIGLKNEGQDIKVIGSNEYFDGTSLVGSSAVTSISQLQSLPNCRMGSTPAGTNNYYMAEQYIKVLHLNCTIVTYSSPVVSIDAAIAGSVPVDVSAYNAAEVAAAAGQVNMLENSTTAAFQKEFIPKNYNGYIQIGIGSNLAKKRASIVAFEEGLMRATYYMETHSTAKVTAILRTASAFKATPATTLSLSVPAAVKFLPKAPDWGFISKAQWAYDLSQYPSFGVAGVTSSDPSAQYAQIIDMSYYNAALKKIAAYKL